MELNLSGADREQGLQWVWGWLWGRSSHLPHENPLSFAYLKGQAWGGDSTPRHSRWGAQGPLRGGLKALGWQRTQWSHSHQWGSQQGLGGLHSPAEGPTSSGSSSGGGKGCQWWRGGTRCSPSTHSPRPTRRTRSVSLGQAGGGGRTRRGVSSAGIWLPADGGTAAAVISGAN